MNRVRIAILCVSTFALIFAATSLANADDASLTAARDNTLFQNSGGAVSNGAGVGLFAGRTAQPSNFLRRGLIYFDLSGDIPAGSVITGVTLRLQVTQAPGAGTPRPFTLHRLLADWGEGTSNATNGGGGAGAPSALDDATWIHTFFNTAFWQSPGGDFESTASATAQVGGVGTQEWSAPGMVADVQAWIDDPAANFGWLLRGAENIIGSARRFASREASGAMRPTLEVTFEAAAPFVRGDCNDDGTVDISDAIFLIQSLFDAPPPIPACEAACDANADDARDIADATVLLAFLFQPLSPLPGPSTCQPTPSLLPCVSSLCF